MKNLISIYCEGTDIKAAVFQKSKERLKLLDAFSLYDILAQKQESQAGMEFPEESVTEDISDEFSFDKSDTEQVLSSDDSTKRVEILNKMLAAYDIRNAEFLPVITEPVAEYYIYEGVRDPDNKKFKAGLVKDIKANRDISVEPEALDFIKTDEGSNLCFYSEGQVPCADLVSSLANLNKKRYFRIPAIKDAELSLASMVIRASKFNEDSFSLIIYTGKEYSKLIFLKGNRLKHIGTTLDIGTENLGTYDVYFSKILLEMENGLIPRLDRVVLTGEDTSDELQNSFFGAFPEASTEIMSFPELESAWLPDEKGRSLNSFAIPVSAALEYYAEKYLKAEGVSILPRYIRENQKLLQFGWHAYTLLVLLFASTFFFTYQMLSNSRQMRDMDREIDRLTILQVKNQTILNEIANSEGKINNFDKSQKIIDDAAKGTGVWNRSLGGISEFIKHRGGLWVTKIETTVPDAVKLSGFSLSRPVVTDFTEFNNKGTLINLLYEPLRERKAFSYLINFKYGQKN